ncbi:hypothetical protein HED55_07370 [Ochrobactrum haematophilum]|uniref:Uncharacterized protein n=1 Tax=Brucella haematophila TaxID=419474 RepID=A0ABX1DPP5_9HYPH|nr:hypothetical protein [Brucella haematophila]
MSNSEKTISTVEALVAATGNETVRHIVISGAIDNLPVIRLRPGQTLQGSGNDALLRFADNDGVELSSNNRISNIRLETSPEKRAIFNDTTVDTIGRAELAGVTTIGRVQILFRDRLRAGHVDVDGLDIIAADARGETDRPKGYGVVCAARRFHPVEHA